MSLSTTYRPNLAPSLVDAAGKYDVEQVKSLVKQGADVNAHHIYKGYE